MGVCRSGDMNYQDYSYAVASLGFSNLCKQCKGSLGEHSHAYASESVSQNSYNKHVSAESLGILMLAKRFGALTICSSISKKEYVVKMNGKPMPILGFQVLKNQIPYPIPILQFLLLKSQARNSWAQICGSLPAVRLRRSRRPCWA